MSSYEGTSCNKKAKRDKNGAKTQGDENGAKTQVEKQHSEDMHIEGVDSTVPEGFSIPHFTQFLLNFCSKENKLIKIVFFFS